MKNKLLLGVVWAFSVLQGCNKNDGNAPTPSLTAKIPVVNYTPKKIVILGSSTAYGIGATSLDSGWVALIKAKLKTYNRKDTVINLAVGGYTTYQVMPSGSALVANRPVPDVKSNITYAMSLNPDVIIINLPSNDFAAGFSSDETLDNYEHIVPIIEAKHVSYFITSTQPRVMISASERQRLKDFNAIMLNVYSASHVIDYYDQLAAPDLTILPAYSAGDGVHLNNNGHSVIYKSFISYTPFKELLNL